jgi:hypothetical protein
MLFKNLIQILFPEMVSNNKSDPVARRDVCHFAALKDGPGEDRVLQKKMDRIAPAHLKNETPQCFRTKIDLTPFEYHVIKKN